MLDFAVSNGQVVQLAHAWSFQLPDQAALVERVRSWGWAIRALRQSGGSVRLKSGQQAGLPAELDVEVLYAPPLAGQTDTRAFDDAMGVFETAGAEAVPLDAADAIAERASLGLATREQSHLLS